MELGRNVCRSFVLAYQLHSLLHLLRGELRLASEFHASRFGGLHSGVACRRVSVDVFCEGTEFRTLLFQAKGGHQSSRNAMAGSTRVARRAGPRHAAMATSASRPLASR